MFGIILIMKKIDTALKIFFIFILVAPIFILKVSAQSLGVSTNINLDWQVLDSYVPPFYEGKPLPGEEAAIKVMASVEVNTPAGTFDASKFFYSWEINDYYSNTYSKTGSNFLIFPLDELVNQNIVELKVYTNNTLETLLATKRITIYPRISKAFLYKDLGNPILTYANAINKRYENYAVSRGESFNIIAEPFYFSVNRSNDSSISYIWSVNKIPGNVNSTNLFSYSAPTTAYNNFGVGVKVTNKIKTLQSSEENINFVFK